MHFLCSLSSSILLILNQFFPQLCILLEQKIYPPCPSVKFSHLSSLFSCKYSYFLLAHYQSFSRCVCYLLSLSLSRMNLPFLIPFPLTSSLSSVLYLFSRLILTIQLSVMLSGFRLYLPGVRKRPTQLPCTQNLPGPSVFFPKERTRQEIEMLNRSRNRERK